MINDNGYNASADTQHVQLRDEAKVGDADTDSGCEQTNK
jgi:hypothetical protein